jgi:energy-coupling factor transporter ATP-binding protein EcfA2
MKKYLLNDVFTPTSSASLTFIERESVNKQLLRALKTTGKQIVIYGHSGSGKTTILTNKLKTIYPNVITTSCESNMKLNDLILDAFNQLNIFYKNSVESTEGGKNSGNVSGGFWGLKLGVSGEISESQKEIEKRLLDVQLTPQTLSKYMGETEHCWVIEDFHKIKTSEKQYFAQIMKIFMDKANTFKKTKIIAIGAVNSAREVVQYEPEMSERISEIFVPLMSYKDLVGIIEKGENLLRIEIEPELKDKIVKYSHGLASITHELCSLMCDNRGIDETSKNIVKFTEKDLEDAIEDYIQQKSDTFKCTYDTATKTKTTRKYDSPQNILEAILKIKKDEVTINQIAVEMKNKFPNYKPTNLKRYVEELASSERREILRFNKDNNCFSFSSPFLKSYANFVIHKQNDEIKTNGKSLIRELKQFLINSLEENLLLDNSDLLDDEFIYQSIDIDEFE